MTDWPHSPVHRLGEGGTFIVTCGTYRKEHFFRGAERLAMLHDSLLSLAGEYDWQLQAWAVFSNHYHFIGLSPRDSGSLATMIRRFHAVTALAVNRLDGVQGRRVWFQYYDTRLTYEKSYLARLRYVHENAVHHGLVREATAYPWCSAAWFERTADPAFRKTVHSFGNDRLNIQDDFSVGTLECGE